MTSNPPTYDTYPITINPWSNVFIPTSEDFVRRLDFQMTNLSGSNFTLNQISWPDTIFAFSIPKEIPAVSTIDVAVYADQSSYATGVRKSLTFELNDVDSTRFTIPVIAAGSDFGESEPCPDEGFHF